jgi:hypothetical protein
MEPDVTEYRVMPPAFRVQYPSGCPSYSQQRAVRNRQEVAKQ